MSELIEYTDSLIAGFNGKAKEYHKWFKANAKLYTNINKEQSKKLSKRSIIKRCYDNCRKIALYKHDLKYIEGYVNALIPIEHAFLIDSDNNIIDPTLAIPTSIESDRYGNEYYGIEIPRNMLIKLSQSKQNYLPMPYLYWEYLNKQGFILGNDGDIS